MSDLVIVSSPGRADFLNTHQDYKGLPVVPVAIDLRMRFYAKLRENNMIRVKSNDLERLGEPSTDEFKISENKMLACRFFGNYLRGVVNVLVKRGLTEKLRGADITIESAIPIGSGLSSSAALEVGFTEVLNHMCNLHLNKRDLAEVSYSAENQEVGIPCGRLDQYGVAFGGIIKLECRPHYDVEPLPLDDLTFAILDSGIRHSTADIHPKRQADIDQGLETLMKSPEVPERIKMKLGHRFFEPRWEEITEDEIRDYLSIVGNKARARILFTLKMQRSTEFALKVLRLQKISEKEILANLGDDAYRKIRAAKRKERAYRILGEVMNYQHSLLRDFYDVSLPELDEICSTAIQAGAYGAKISGAGMGGSIIALVENEKVGEKVISECLSAGARNGWVSKVGEGVRVESP